MLKRFAEKEMFPRRGFLAAVPMGIVPRQNARYGIGTYLSGGGEFCCSLTSPAETTRKGGKGSLYLDPPPHERATEAIKKLQADLMIKIVTRISKSSLGGWPRPDGNPRNMNEFPSFKSWVEAKF